MVSLDDTTLRVGFRGRKRLLRIAGLDWVWVGSLNRREITQLVSARFVWWEATASALQLNHKNMKEIGQNMRGEVRMQGDRHTTGQTSEMRVAVSNSTCMPIMA